MVAVLQQAAGSCKVRAGKEEAGGLSHLDRRVLSVSC